MKELKSDSRWKILWRLKINSRKRRAISSVSGINIKFLADFNNRRKDIAVERENEIKETESQRGEEGGGGGREKKKKEKKNKE